MVILFLSFYHLGIDYFFGPLSGHLIFKTDLKNLDPFPFLMLDNFSEPQRYLIFKTDLKNLDPFPFLMLDDFSGATPKGILKTGQSWAKHLSCQKPLTGGKFERRNISELLPNFSTTCAAQLNEALQMQNEVQKRMSDQLEVQMRLKLKLEAQGRFLDQITEEHRNQATNTKPRKPVSPISLPSLCEESESNAKELESDSEADRNEIQSEEGFRVPKRLRVDEDVLSPSCINASVNLESYSQAMFLQKEMQISYPDHGLSFPWSIAACSSPLVPSFF